MVSALTSIKRGRPLHNKTVTSSRHSRRPKRYSTLGRSANINLAQPIQEPRIFYFRERLALYTHSASAYFSEQRHRSLSRATQVSQTTTEYWILLRRVCSALVFNRCKADSMIALQSKTQLSGQVEQDAILQALLDANRNPGYEDLMLLEHRSPHCLPLRLLGT